MNAQNQSKKNVQIVQPEDSYKITRASSVKASVYHAYHYHSAKLV